MFGSFLPNLWSSCNQSVRSREPTLLCNQSYRPRASDRTMVDNVKPRSLSCFRIRKRRHENRMDLRRAKTQEPLNMTWTGKQSEQPRSFQSPETYLLLTFPFIERANRRSSFSRAELCRFHAQDFSSPDS